MRNCPKRNLRKPGNYEQVFAEEEKPLEVLIEYEVGEVRSGIVEDEQLTDLVRAISACRHVVLKGIFSHEGHTYKADDMEDCVRKAKIAYDFSRCAATVLASVISKPHEERVAMDSGAKALVSQNRPTGICATKGFGAIKDAEHINIDNLFDEHAVLNSAEFRDMVEIGDKVEVIPSHICPTVNLYDMAYLVSGGKVLGTLPVECRGKSQ